MGVGGWAGYGCWRMGRIWVLEDGQDMGVGGWAGYGCWRMGRIWVLEDKVQTSVHIKSTCTTLRNSN